MIKAMRMTSPFQQENSRVSEHQRRFERMTMTLPSWMRRDHRLGRGLRRRHQWLRCA